MYHPTRGGVRGGADQFNWEDVKGDKHRENYLGHSVKAPVGRWQKGKDLSWYSKDRTDEENISFAKKQIAAIQAAEEEAMLAALGHKQIKRVAQPLSREELSEVLQRTNTEREGERIAGVGKQGSQFFSSSFNKAPKNGIAFQGPKEKSTLSPPREIEPLDRRERKRSTKSKHHKKSKHKHKEGKRIENDSSDTGRSSKSGKRSSSSDRNYSKIKRRRHDSDSSDSN